MIGLLLLTICVIAETGRELCFKRAAGPLNAAVAAGDWRQALLRVPLWAGLTLWAGEMLLWILTLQHLPLGIAFPLMALSLATIPLAGWLLLHERITRTQCAGILLITTGAACVGLSGL